VCFTACRLEHFTLEKVITVIDDRLKVQFSRHHRPSLPRQFAKNTSCRHQPRHLFSSNAFKITASDARAGFSRASVSARQEGQVCLGKTCRAMPASYLHLIRTTIVCVVCVARPCIPPRAAQPRGGWMCLHLKHVLLCRRLLDYDAYRRQVNPRLLCRCTCAAIISILV
jgi:hypothetical protein